VSSKLIDKFLGGVDWGEGELDHVLISPPSGTGDVQPPHPLIGAASRLDAA